MAGLGRRTHYRKHLTDSVLHDLPEPKDDQRIAKVVSTRGGNQFDIVLASSEGMASNKINNNNDNTSDRTPQLAILPTKFRKLVWVKRNDFVIVQTGRVDDDDNDDDKQNNDKIDSSNGDEHDSSEKAQSETKQVNHQQGGIRYIVTHILYKDQVKHLRSKGLWPENDPEFEGTIGQFHQNSDEDEVENEDGIVYKEHNDDDDDLFVNTNQVARLEIQESEEDSSDEED